MPAAALFGLALIAPAARGAAVAVDPVAYRAGPVPVTYNLTGFTDYPAAPGSIADITDGSLDTFTELNGLDNALQSNNVRADTGTFYLLEYQIDPAAESFRIDFTARSDAYPSLPFGNFSIETVPVDGFQFSTVLTGVPAPEPTTFGVEFTRGGNTGNVWYTSDLGLGSLPAPDGRLQLVLNGAFLASQNEPGRVSTRLYEAEASYVLPEPGALPLLAAAVPLLLARRRPRPARAPRAG
jgi:hypothetical protein